MNLPLIFFIFLVIVVITMMVTYNVIIKAYNRVDEAWSDVDVQLKRRYDLIPNLVKIAQHYAEHEFEIFMAVKQAHSDVVEAEIMNDPEGVVKQDNVLKDTLKSLFALTEDYPSLRANENFLELQKELAETENKIQSSRRFYNATVLDYNNKIKMFPTNAFALVYDYKKRPFFDFGEEVRQNVEINFNK